MELKTQSDNSLVGEDVADAGRNHYDVEGVRCHCGEQGFELHRKLRLLDIHPVAGEGILT